MEAKLNSLNDTEAFIYNTNYNTLSSIIMYLINVFFLCRADRLFFFLCRSDRFFFSTFFFVFSTPLNPHSS